MPASLREQNHMFELSMSALTQLYGFADLLPAARVQEERLLVDEQNLQCSSLTW